MPTDDEAGEFIKISEDLVQLPVIKDAGTTEVDFDGLLTKPLRLREDLAEGCGGQLWPAGMLLTKYMLQNLSLWSNKTIIELGAGGGLVGLALALRSDEHQKPLWITDQMPMLALMRRNIELNGLGGQVQAEVYDWGKPRPLLLPKHPDVILAADCVYFEPAFPLLQKTMLELIGDETVCYFCFKKRRRADMHFVKAIKKLFSVQDVKDDPAKPTWSRENLFIGDLIPADLKERPLPMPQVPLSSGLASLRTVLALNKGLCHGVGSIGLSWEHSINETILDEPDYKS